MRIIAGAWRGRKLPVTVRPGLRPTGDRVRETLFNWLAPRLTGARCLDLFAGTGALGLEAASRGAAAVTLVEQDRAAAAALDAAVATLAATTVEVVCADARAWVAQGRALPFDIVFVDPPFGTDLLAAVLPELASLVRVGGVAYVESAAGTAPAPPAGFDRERERRFGDVLAQLWRRRSATAGPAW